VLERDAAPVPDSPEHAWEAWERRGVAQFRAAAARGDARMSAPPGPGRQELLEILSSAGAPAAAG
jgi:hypothetical protein